MRAWSRMCVGIVVVGVLCGGCGSHKQENRFHEPKEVLVSGEEKDPTQQLINAVENGDLESLEDALEMGGDPNTMNQQSMTLLMLAVRSKQFAVIAMLIGAGGDPAFEQNVEESGDEPVSAFDYIGGGEATQGLLFSLLNGEPIVSEDTRIPLFEAIKDLNTDNVSWLLSKGADPNSIWKKKKTPLIHLFSFTGVEGDRFVKLEVIFHKLVEHKDIDVNLKAGRNTALKKAKSRARRNPNYQPLVDILLAKGATP